MARCGSTATFHYSTGRGQVPQSGGCDPLCIGRGPKIMENGDASWLPPLAREGELKEVRRRSDQHCIRGRVLTAVTAALTAALTALAGCASKDPGGPPAEASCNAVLAPRPAGLLVAGSGTNLAVTHAIASRYHDKGGPQVVVPESIGTSGALKALRERAIDVALASRPLKAEERRDGLVETALCMVPFAATVRDDVPVAGLTASELTTLFNGERATWPGGSSVVLPLFREPGDSGELLIAAAMPRLALAIRSAANAERGTLCYTDQQVRDTLLVVQGAVGFLDVATIILEGNHLRALALDGVAATRSNVKSGRYPLAKPLSFVTLGAPDGEARRFIDYARSPAVADILARAEIVPAVDAF
jgi:phosphate transport system substrate-binding protein